MTRDEWLEFSGERWEGRSGARDAREEVSRLSPADELMWSGQRLYYQGEFLAAAREFRGARRHDPALFDAWAAEVEARLRGGDLERAAEVAAEALSSYGKVPVFYAAKALVLAHQGDIEGASMHSDISVKHQGASLFTWLARAEVVLALGEPWAMPSVETCFRRASEADPSHWRANFRAALALIRWGHLGRALDRLSHVTQFIPGNPFVWKTMGDCHQALGDLPAARSCYAEALARRHDYLPAQQALEATTAWGRFRRAAQRWLSRLRGTRDA